MAPADADLPLSRYRPRARLTLPVHHVPPHGFRPWTRTVTRVGGSAPGSVAPENGWCPTSALGWNAWPTSTCTDS